MIIVWHRLDLRIQDNPALWHGVETKEPILPIYIYDESLVKEGNSSLWWLKESLKELQTAYHKRGITLIVLKGNVEEELLSFIDKAKAKAVFWNTRVEPIYRQLDEKIEKALVRRGIEGKKFDQEALSLPEEILNQQGRPFSIFKAYWNRLIKEDIEEPLPDIKKMVPSSGKSFVSEDVEDILTMNKRVEKTDHFKEWNPGSEGALKRFQFFMKNHFDHYAETRDFPFQDVTSYLSPHIHFGEISMKQIWTTVWDKPKSKNRTSFLQELAWREFAYYLLYHYPKMPKENWNSRFNFFSWGSHKDFLKKWKEGKTGYPIVDAGMRQLLQSGWMHNRVRMIVASFLIKDGLIHWKEGVKWFEEQLVDADMANNTLGWQWSAGSGPNANPFFRVFSPVLQGEKYDPEGEYVKKYVPELSRLPKKWIHRPWEAPEEVLLKAQVKIGKTFPKPIVDHKEARKIALQEFKNLSS